jgi:Lipid A core - O-antigen ligase and related enzymes
LAALAFFSGVMGSLLSASRGGWVGLPLIMVFLLWQSRDLLGKKLVIGICLLGVMGAVTICNIPKLGVSNRIYEAAHNIEMYLQGDSNTSVGLRFEMWKASVYMLADSPIFGVGEYSSKEFKQKLSDEGVITQITVEFDHAHNEYLDALGLRGLVGFLALMAVYLVPLRLFLAKMREHQDNWNIKAYAIGGALIPMSYMDFALTQSMFSHNIGVMMYVFPIAFFWAATRWAEKEAKGEV